MHTIAVLACNDFIPLDLSIPCAIFGHGALANADNGYRLVVCGAEQEVQSQTFSIRPPGTLADLMRADTVIVSGIEDFTQPVSATIIEALQAAWANGARIASICTGAFVLGAAGLLDGRRATTHWMAADLLAQRYPATRVDRDVLFVDEGRIITSAGAAAGIDMCLHLLRRDHGQAAAADAARLAVAPLEREGGQSQFIRHEMPGSSSSLAPLLDWMRDNAHRHLSIEELARQAATSPRTLARRFRDQTGTTPMQWLIGERVRRAQALLETTQLPIEKIASDVGFSDAMTLRDRFRQIVGVNPRAYRRSFGAESSEPSR